MVIEIIALPCAHCMRSVGRYAPPLALMGLIFILSAQSGLPSVDSRFDVALRKAAHMTEFGLLWALLLRALPGTPARRALLALAIALAYTVSDEFHQSFVANRHPSPFDVAIDAAGIGFASALWVARTRRTQTDLRPGRPDARPGVNS